ncbi:MAG: RagB/SusD family nutrient uptake outer membrane protein [Microscillaceae bacterium]|nr:RagB/SusD family nutrient uptake outer membrane protein [Microscillaceae bacterium]MDW8460044.1 RagB/SusD family nutrient uptake outer membrane protein [Cytophagales bacterium]
MKILKHSIKITLIVLLFIAGSACDRVLDVKPTDILDQEKALQNLDDYEAALVGCYTPLRGAGYYGRALYILPDMMSDNLAEITGSLGNYREMTDWFFTPATGEVSNFFIAAYTAIGRANLIINTIGKFEATNQRKANRIKGQALAIRAMAHFDLLRIFGQSYERNSSALGVPIVKVFGQPSLKPKRNTVKEVYDAVFEDLLAAEELLQPSNVDISEGSTGFNKNFLSLRAVRFLLARVSQYAEQWQDAVKYATDAIGNLQPATGAAYDGIWENDNYANVGEVIWAVRYNTIGEGRIAAPVTFFSGNYLISFLPSQALMSLYNTGDRRINAFTRVLTTSGSAGGKRAVSKFLGRGGQPDGVVDAKAFRLSELYLIRAEANRRLGNNTDAVADLNAVRNARNAGALSTAEQNDFFLAIENERRREFAFEGHRWFDFRRYKKGIQRGTDCQPPATACSLPADSPRFVWPIPQSEILANPNMEQNPGY